MRERQRQWKIYPDRISGFLFSPRFHYEAKLNLSQLGCYSDIDDNQRLISCTSSSPETNKFACVTGNLAFPSGAPLCGKESTFSPSSEDGEGGQEGKEREWEK